jgi:putative chitinase
MTIKLTNVARHFKGLPQQVKALEYLQSQTSVEVMAEFERLWRTVEQPRVTGQNLYNIAMYNSLAKLNPFVVPLNEGFAKYQLNSALRVCHFIAQVMHESGEFAYQQEIADGSEYEGRTNLGNTQPGDGMRFKGRGLIQVTGRSNYGQISKDLGIDYIANPQRLEQLPDCVNSAFWYWNSRNLNALADKDDLNGITRAINGGLNGLEQRQEYLLRAKKELGIWF